MMCFAPNKKIFTGNFLNSTSVIPFSKGQSQINARTHSFWEIVCCKQQESRDRLICRLHADLWILDRFQNVRVASMMLYKKCQ